MATTIKLKNGTGAPLAGDLVQGEPALDLTNKRLYTENASGTVIEIGTNPTSLTTGTFTSTGIDDNAASTAITIDSSGNVTVGGTTAGNAGAINLTAGSPGSTVGGLQLWSTTSGSHFLQFGDTASGDGYYRGAVGYLHASDALVAYSAGAERMRISSAGDVQIGTAAVTGGRYFDIYNTGSTATDFAITRFITQQVGSASTTSADIIKRKSGQFGFINNDTHADAHINFTVGASERMRINSSGNVGIGVVPDSFNTVDGALQVGTRNTITSFSNDIGIGYNHYYNSGWKYANADVAARFSSTSTTPFLWQYAASGSADGAITWSEAMRIDSSGNLDLASDFYVGSSNNIIYESGTTFNVRAAVANLTFQTNGANERMRIDSSGNVGIGVSNPGAYDSRAERLVVGESGDAGITIACGSSSDARLVFAVTNQTDLSNGSITYDQSNDSMSLETAGSERMRIDGSGNVGINTSSPSGVHAPLTIKNNPSYLGSQINFQNAYTTDFYIGINGDTTGDILYYVGGAKNQAFYTSGTERMRIDTSGNLLVNRTTQIHGGKISVDYQNGVDAGIALKDTQTTGTGVPMQVVNGAGSVVGSITHDQSNTSFNTSSDERLKENIVDAPSGNIDGIRVRSFDWKASGVHQTYGMIAQELVGVAPEAVTKETAGNDMWSIDYSKLVPMMIKEIQDLKAEVAALKGA